LSAEEENAAEGTEDAVGRGSEGTDSVGMSISEEDRVDEEEEVRLLA
jgi:hypothetical protein